MSTWLAGSWMRCKYRCPDLSDLYLEYCTCIHSRDNKFSHVQGVGAGSHLIPQEQISALDMESQATSKFPYLQTKPVETQNVFPKIQVWKTTQQLCQQLLKELRERAYDRLLKIHLSQSAGLVTICLHQNM